MRLAQSTKSCSSSSLRTDIQGEITDRLPGGRGVTWVEVTEIWLIKHRCQHCRRVGHREGSRCHRAGAAKQLDQGQEA